MKNRRGAAAVEYAVVLPVLLGLILGLVDWSWYMYSWLNVRMAVGRGVRIAAGTIDDPEGAAEAAVWASLDRTGVDHRDATLTTARTSDASGPVLEVTLAKPFTAPVGLVRSPATLRVTASTSLYGYVYESP